MDDFISYLIEYLEIWANKYDISKSIKFNISEASHSFFLNDIYLCPAEAKIINEINMTSKSFKVYFTDKTFIIIKFSWPEDNPPCISSVHYIGSSKE